MFFDDGVVFLADSTGPLPDLHLHGTCFVGHDLISGTEAAEKFESETGRAVVCGEDGHYVLARRRSATEWEIGTDHKGFHHLFFHRADGFWAVSNSLYRLKEHLVAAGRSVTTNHWHFAAWSEIPHFVRSHTSFRTGIDEIELLPSSQKLIVTSTQLTQSTVSLAPPAENYADALDDFLTTWESRFRTVLSDDRLSMVLHVTGGQDSRTVLAMVLPILHSLRAEGHEPDIRFKSSLGHPDDLAVARELAIAGVFDLNEALPSAGDADDDVTDQSRPYSARERFEHWRDIHLGSYSHIMFPLYTPGADRLIPAPGVGGEAHRYPYVPKAHRQRDMESFTELQRKRFANPDFFDAWQRSLIDADDVLRSAPDAHDNTMVRHHREFRDRAHTGKAGFFRINSVALSGRHLMRASNALPQDTFATGQVLRDVASNTSPHLLMLPYDDPKKSMTGSMVRDLHRLDRSTSTTQGRAFLSTPSESGTTPDSEYETPLRYVLDLCKESMGHKELMDIVGRDQATEIVENLEGKADGPVQNLQRRGHGAHQLAMAAALM